MDDVTDLSPAESATLSLHPAETNLAAIARAALAAQRPQLKAAGIHIEADLARSVAVCVDADRMHQAIADVLANAGRYCRLGYRVAIRAEVDAGRAGCRHRTWDPGRRSAARVRRLWRGRHARGVAGCGIGLAVVRELVAAHDGIVTAASPAGSATTVTIRLPVSERASAPVVSR